MKELKKSELDIYKEIDDMEMFEIRRYGEHDLVRIRKVVGGILLSDRGVDSTTVFIPSIIPVELTNWGG
ncbi:MAG: hypothetical protein GY941_28975 [Planctomycetes bacterium]|nr:hypothetical protein [Planctomycetota bacterium]